MEQPETENQKNRKEQNKGFNHFARYTGMAFQMLAVILICTFGGVKLDKITGWDTPVFTIILSLFGVFAGIYLAVKDFLKQ